MIRDEKKYIIDGWAVKLLLEIVRNLKITIQNNYKIYKKEEFINILRGYDNTISYLVNLKNAELILSAKEQKDEKKRKTKVEKDLHKILKDLGIPIQNLDDDDGEKK